MNYEDEKWIKVYTRDTAAWLALPWQARGLMLEIARKIPQLTGELSLGRKGLATIAALLRAEWSEIEPYIRELIADGRLVFDEERQVLCDPQHVERQTAIASGAARNRTYKEKRRVSQIPKKTEQSKVTKGDAGVTKGDARRPLEETRREEIRSDQIRESENARAREASPDGVVRSDLPLLDDARAKYETIASVRRLDTPVEDTWLAFCGHHAGALLGSRDGVLGKFQKWLVDQAKRDEKERHARRDREERDAKRDKAFAERFPSKSDVAPMRPYAPARDRPEPAAEEQRLAQREAQERLRAGVTELFPVANDTATSTGTDE